MAKKFQLTELKVTSFVTTLNKGEQKTAKGGYLGARRANIRHIGSRADWTSLKTQIISFSSESLKGGTTTHRKG